MTSTNTGHTLDTIKGHGLAVGARFTFHGMGADPIPTAEGTRVEISKVGAKYMLTTVTGDVHTWEFGPSAKVWADTSVSHHVTTDTRTLDNGDTVYVGQCEHGWMTGFHLTEADARDVATGHGEVSRPLYAAPVVPVEVPAIGTTVVTPDGIVGMVEARYSTGTVNVFGIIACASVGTFHPDALAVITEDNTRDAQNVIKQNGRVFTAEAGNFGVPVGTWSVLVAHGWATLVNDGDMSRWVRTRRTADRKVITDGLAVWDYNLNPGRVIMSTMDGDGWFNVLTADGDRSLMNGERVTTVHPSTRQTATDALAEDTAPLDIPTRAEETALINEHDTAMREWARPLVAVLTVPAPVPTEAEVWAGTGTVVTYPIRRPVRTNLNKRKRKATKVNARRVRGGF